MTSLIGIFLQFVDDQEGHAGSHNTQRYRGHDLHGIVSLP